MPDKKTEAGWFARLRAKRRAKRQRAAERAYQEASQGVPKRGSGAPRSHDHGGFAGG
jgi:hypothetical protein